MDFELLESKSGQPFLDFSHMVSFHLNGTAHTNPHSVVSRVTILWGRQVENASQFVQKDSLITSHLANSGRCLGSVFSVH
jgi:hypothetical protein